MDLKRALEPALAIGEYPGEPETKRAGRRVFLVALVIATIFTFIQVAIDLSGGKTLVGIVNLVAAVAPILVLPLIARWPQRIDPLLHLMFALITVGTLIVITMYGGLLESGLQPLYLSGVALAAMLAIDLRAAIVWFGVFFPSVVYSALLPRWVEPVYTLDDQTAPAAFALITTGILTLAVLAYFIRQRDRFQRRSDDLLHAILPEEIAHRLKTDGGTIADDVASASVLFADVVDFTSMSASMTPARLVSLLNEVFTAFDGYVAELGLEKIKTIGDAYMVAAGVPEPRADHAHAIAELALMIRDHTATNPVSGEPVRFRIGIDSGPVTAGVIGSRKFAYDLWGDTVNTASRMESGGIPGQIQVSSDTCELIKDRYALEPRGTVTVKGKGEMETYLLRSELAEPSRTV